MPAPSRISTGTSPDQMPLRRSHKQHFCPGVPINWRPVATRPESVHKQTALSKQTVSTELARLGRSYRPGLKSTSGGSLTLTSRRPAGGKTRAFRSGGGRSSSAQSGKSRVKQSGPSLNFESFLLWRSRDRCRRHLLSVCVCYSECVWGGWPSSAARVLSIAF